MGDTIGQKGLQLFIDAGQPVNNNLVNAIVREVIAEKVGSLLGRRREADSADPGSVAAKARGAAGGAGADAVVDSEPEFVRVSEMGRGTAGGAGADAVLDSEPEFVRVSEMGRGAAGGAGADAIVDSEPEFVRVSEGWRGQ